MSNQNQGPDRILEADNLTTTDRYGCVKLRIIEDDSFKYDAVSIPTYFERWANKGPKKTALAVKREGEWVKWTYEEYRRDVLFAAKAFIHLGLDPFSSVAIFGFNAPEWFIAALGAIHAQGLCTGLYPTNSRETNGFILHDAKARVLVVEDAAAVEKVWPLLDEVDSLRTIVQYLGEPSRPGVIGWKQLMDIGKAEGDMELKRRLSNMAINNAATLIYTSGTTGNPKGVMLSHDNILFTAESALECCNWRKHKVVVVSYLPLSHIAAMLTDIYGVMGSCGTTYFADKNALKGTLVDTLKEVRPTHFFGVPRVWEKIMEGMLDKGKSVTGLKRKIADKCKQAGLQHHLQGKSGIKYKISEALLFKKVREALGLDRTVGFYSAAAPLGMETMRYFLSLDIVLMELYGMSETTGPHCITNDEYQRIGSVGKVMPGVRARLSEPNSDGEGEMCMWGRNVMMGYLNREDKTSEDVDLEGWMHSGDLATEDKNGYYYITGRIKELLITAGGENVAPVPVEERIKQELPIVSNAVLIGDKRKFLTVFLTLKTVIDRATDAPTSELTPSAIDWCRSLGPRNSEIRTVDDILRGPDPVVMAAIQAGIDRANSGAVSNASRVQRWTVLPLDLSINGGELGPTMKLKRYAFNKKYACAVDRLYA